MRLTSLDAQFLKHTGNGNALIVPTIGEADGVLFLCPKCFATKGGKVGCHSVICWFKGKVPDDIQPKPGRWDASGSGIDNLTLAPSVELDPQYTDADAANARAKGLEPCCKWHGFVQNGDAA